MAKYNVSLSIGFVGAVHEDVLDIDDEELANCKTEDERDDLLQECWQEWANNYIDGAITEAEPK